MVGLRDVVVSTGRLYAVTRCLLISQYWCRTVSTSCSSLSRSSR